MCWLASCTSTQKMLCRTWKVDDVQFVDAPDANSALKDAIAKSLKSSVTFTFMKDSVYRIVSNGEAINSKWWLSKDKKAIFAIDPNGKVVESKVEGLKPGYFKINFPANNNNPGYILTCSPVAN